MQYPLLSEYRESILNAEDNFDKLTYLQPVLDNKGEPVMTSGNFAMVFKMTDGKKNYAVKCFTKEQNGRTEAYRLISEELELIDSHYITNIKYFEKELFVDCNCDENEFPILLMDWVEGESMEKYIADNYHDNYAMSMLCYRFCNMAAWLRSQPFAHGDLKPDNIMVCPDGKLTMVDYDGMFVPAMKDQKSPSIGTKNFSHPLRTVDDFDETIDDFTLASIALSLKAISLKPTLYDKYCEPDRLLFSNDDYLDLSNSKVLKEIQELLGDNDVAKLLSLFLMSFSKKDLSMSSFRLFDVKRPLKVDTDSIEKWYLYKRGNTWIAKAVLKSGRFIANSILYNLSNNGVIVDSYSQSLIELYGLENCDSFCINTSAIVVSGLKIAGILSDTSSFEINDIHWGNAVDNRKWKTNNVRLFSVEEQDTVEKATVVDSQYGLSVCFFMKGGGQTYIPLSNMSALNINDIVNLKTAKLLTLVREGETDIYRVLE